MGMARVLAGPRRGGFRGWWTAAIFVAGGCDGGLPAPLFAHPPVAAAPAPGGGASTERPPPADAGMAPALACVDPDGDGFGAGPGCAGPDCDETQALLHAGCADTGSVRGVLETGAHAGHTLSIQIGDGIFSVAPGPFELAPVGRDQRAARIFGYPFFEVSRRFDLRNQDRADLGTIELRADRALCEDGALSLAAAAGDVSVQACTGGRLAVVRQGQISQLDVPASMFDNAQFRLADARWLIVAPRASSGPTPVVLLRLDDGQRRSLILSAPVVDYERFAASPSGEELFGRTETGGLERWDLRSEPARRTVVWPSDVAALLWASDRFLWFVTGAGAPGEHALRRFPIGGDGAERVVPSERPEHVALTSGAWSTAARRGWFALKAPDDATGPPYLWRVDEASDRVVAAEAGAVPLHVFADGRAVVGRCAPSSARLGYRTGTGCTAIALLDGADGRIVAERSWAAPKDLILTGASA